MRRQEDDNLLILFVFPLFPLAPCSSIAVLDGVQSFQNPVEFACDFATGIAIAQINAAEKSMPKRSTLRLTTRFVNALRTDGKDAFFWDHELPGFGVRVQKNGRKVYVVQSRGPYGIKRVTLGPCADLPIDRRRREAAAVIDRIKRGEDPMAAPPGSAGIPKRWASPRR